MLDSNLLKTRAHSSGFLKNTTLILLLWSFIIVLLLSLDIVSLNNFTKDLVLNEARSNFNKDEAFRFWSATHGGFYVPVSERTNPSPYLSHIPDRDIQTTSGIQLTLMNPAWALRQMNEDFIETYGVAGHITSLLPLRPENGPDSWETDTLELFEQGKLEVSEFVNTGNQPLLRLMKPLITQEGCLKCHAHQGYEVGDIRGGVSISIPMEPYLEKEKVSTRKHILSFIVLWLIGSIIIILGSRNIRKNILKQESSAAELYNSKKQLEAVYNNLDSSIYITDMQTNEILYINDHMESEFGKNLTGTICWKSLQINMDGPCAFCTNDKLINTDGSPSKPYIWETYNKKLKRWYELHDQAIPWSDGRLVRFEMVIDITERKQLKDEIQYQLELKETILKESHHRIKNNFSSIGSLLSLQINSLTNPKAISALQDALGRVDSMKILYEKLLITDEYNSTSLKKYIEDLIDDIIRIFPKHINISVKKQIKDFKIETKRLVPIGIIVNELLTNTMKYGFPGRDSGLIDIKVSENKGNVILTIQDNGVGLPKEFDKDKQKGFGLMLVDLLSQQLEGQFSIESNNGTRSILEFPFNN